MMPFFGGAVFMKRSGNDLFFLYELYFHIMYVVKKKMAVGAPLIKRCLF